MSATAPSPDVEGLEAYKELIADTRRVYLDFRVYIDGIIAERDQVTTRWTFQGTHKGQGTLIPIPTTGKQVTLSGSTVGYLVEGKAVEQQFYADWLGLLQQLGVVPPLEQGGE